MLLRECVEASHWTPERELSAGQRSILARSKLDIVRQAVAGQRRGRLCGSLEGEQTLRSQAKGNCEHARGREW